MFGCLYGYRVARLPGSTVLVYWGRRGGGARYTYELARSLRDLGHRDLVVSLNADNELMSLFDELSGGSFVELDRRRFSMGIRPWAALLPGPWSFGSWCRRRHGTVIVTMGNPLSLPLALTLRAARVPFVQVVHDSRSHPGERAALMHLSVRWAARLATHVVALSSSVAQDLVDSWGIAATRVSVIPHGPFYATEADRLPREPSGTDEAQREPTVLFLGRILAYKGLDLLLEAWGRIEHRGGAHLIVAGEGDLVPFQGLLGSADDVTVRNTWLSDAEIIQLMTQADLLVLPYVEASQSGVIGIAHSFGVPVLCTDVGGLVEQARTDRGDRIVAANAASLAEGIRQFLTDPAPARSPGASPGDWTPIAEAFEGLVVSGSR